MNQDSMFKRLRESVLHAMGGQERVTEPFQQVEKNAREAIRTLARQRVGNLLRELRATHGFSYADIQQKTGLTQQTLYDVEFKGRRLTLDELRLLADCYELSPGDILGVELE